MRDQAVLGGVEEHRRDARRLDEGLLLRVGADRVVRQRRQPAVARCAEADALHCVGAAVGALVDLLAREGDLHRPADLHRGDGGIDRLRADAELAAEAAADIGGEHLHLVRRKPDGLGHLLHVVRDELVAAVQRQRVAVIGGDAGVRLHRRMALARRREGRVVLDLGLREGLLEVALRHVAHLVARIVGLVPVRLQIVAPDLRAVAHLHELGGGARRLEAFRDDEAERLAVMGDAAIVLRRRRRTRLARRAHGALVHDHADHAAGLFRLLRGDLGNGAGADLGKDQIAVGDVLALAVLVGVGRLPRDLQRSLEAVERLADHAFGVPVEAGVGLRLVVAVALGGLAHRSIPVASASTAGRVRRISSILKLFSP